MLDKILSFTESVAAFFLLLVAALTFSNVCVRYLFDTQIRTGSICPSSSRPSPILWVSR